MAQKNDSGAIVGYEAELWQMANTLRGSMDAAEYKHVVLGLIFLKYISDAFEERRAAIIEEWGEDAAEDRDEYRAENIFWVPAEARWEKLRAGARQPVIGQLVDDAMSGIERDNPALKDVLPKDYARQALDKQRLGQLIDLISNIRVGDAESRSRDVLGRIYEYFLSQFASAEGKEGRRVLHAALRGRTARRNDRAVPGPRVRPGAAVRPACSCSRSSLSTHTPAATATAAKHTAISASTVRSPTIRPGGSPK